MPPTLEPHQQVPEKGRGSVCVLCTGPGAVLALETTFVKAVSPLPGEVEVLAGDSYSPLGLIEEDFTFLCPADLLASLMDGQTSGDAFLPQQILSSGALPLRSRSDKPPWCKWPSGKQWGWEGYERLLAGLAGVKGKANQAVVWRGQQGGGWFVVGAGGQVSCLPSPAWVTVLRVIVVATDFRRRSCALRWWK